MVAELDELKAKLAKVQARQSKLQAQLSECRTEEMGIRKAMRRYRLMLAQGVPDGVRYSVAHLFSKPLAGHPRLMDTGTLLEVRRTRATVVFAGVEWLMPLEHLEAVDAPVRQADEMVSNGEPVKSGIPF